MSTDSTGEKPKELIESRSTSCVAGAFNADGDFPAGMGLNEVGAWFGGDATDGGEGNAEAFGTAPDPGVTELLNPSKAVALGRAEKRDSDQSTDCRLASRFVREMRGGEWDVIDAFEGMRFNPLGCFREGFRELAAEPV